MLVAVCPCKTEVGSEMRYILILLALVFIVSANAETTDAAVAMSSGAGAGGDAFLDELDYIDLEAIGGTARCVGVGFDGTNFWVTDAQSGGGPLWIHIIDGSTHNLITTIDQAGTSGWGLRDLCSDGTYMFGSEDNQVDIYDIASYTFIGSYMCFATSPNRAQAWDGTYFYTGSFAAEIYQVTWDGVFGSTASFTLWSSAISNDGTYGAAWDAYNDCLWVSTAASDNKLYQLDSSGTLIAEHTYNILMAGGSTMGSYSGSADEQLWVLEQGSPDALHCYETGPLALEQHSWGGIKALF